jgi:hypothetical protein
MDGLCLACLLALNAAFVQIDLDIGQTQNAIASGYYEMNPMLGESPSNETLNLVAVGLKISLLGINLLPWLSDNFKISLNKSIEFTESMVVQNNGRFKEWPPAIGVVIAWQY